MEMTQEREGSILEGALVTFGEDVQIDMMIEEMSELTKALLKERRSLDASSGVDELEKLEDSIREEIADVQIMLNQMQLIFGDCTDWEIKKLERLAERLRREGFDSGAD